MAFETVHAMVPWMAPPTSHRIHRMHSMRLWQICLEKGIQYQMRTHHKDRLK